MSQALVTSHINARLRLGLKRVLRVFQSKTSINTGWVLLGNFGVRGLALVSFSLITRVLGPDEYGTFSVALAVMSMAVELSDLGINASAIRYGAQFAENKQWDQLSTLYSIVLRSRLLIGLLLFAAGVVAAQPLAVYVFREPELSLYLVLAFAGIFSAILNSAFVSLLQANQQFRQSVLVNLVQGATIAIGTLVLWLFGVLTSLNALVIYLAAPMVATVAALAFFPRNLLTLRRWDAVLARRLFDFGKWMALWSLTSVLQSRLDIFMLTNMMGTGETAYYSVAYRIALLAQMVPAAYGTVLTPKISSAAGSPRLKTEFRKSLVLSIGFSLLIVVSVLLAPIAVLVFSGNAYTNSVVVLQILLVGMAFFTLNLPFGTTLYALDKPHIIAISTLVSLFMTFALNIWLIPVWGAVGAAATFAVAQLFVVIVCACVVALDFRKNF